MHFWDITVELDDGEETIRGLTEAQKISLLEVFDSLGLQATAIEFDAERQPTENKDSVN